MPGPGRTIGLLAFLALVLGMSQRAGAADAFLAGHELRGWDVLGEAPVDVSADPDLVEWGVRETAARHYSRDHRGTIEVCSVEIWRFWDEAKAAAAAGGFAFPDWQIDRVGSSLVMVRGMLRPRGRPPQRGVFPACDAIGARIRERAGALAP